MKKIIIKSLLTSVIFEVVGLIINLISYRVDQSFLIAMTINGCEWGGRLGFGLLLNKTYPFTAMTLDHSAKSRTWIEFSFPSLIATLILGFVLGFVFFYAKAFIGKRKKKANAEQTNAGL